MMIDEGTYDAMPIGWGLLESQSVNNPEQFAIEFEITAEGPHQGERIMWFGTFSDKAFEYRMQRIRAAGLVGDDLRSLARETSDHVRIAVKHDTYQGETRAKVASIFGGSLLQSRALSPDRAAMFAEKMRARIKAFDARTGEPATAPTHQARRPAQTTINASKVAPSKGRPPGDAETAHDMDDIPF